MNSESNLLAYQCYLRKAKPTLISVYIHLSAGNSMQKSFPCSKLFLKRYIIFDSWRLLVALFLILVWSIMTLLLHKSNSFDGSVKWSIKTSESFLYFSEGYNFLIGRCKNEFLSISGWDRLEHELILILWIIHGPSYNFIGE